MESVSSKEKFLLCNTLACVPPLLRGKAVLVDLRNETSIAGRIEYADGYMNLNMVDVVFIDRHGLQYEFDEFSVKGRYIRQIHIPESIDIESKLNSTLAKIGKREPRAVKHTFKGKRAKARHEEILCEIAAKNKEAQK